MKICMIAYSRFETDGRLHRYSFSLNERGDEVHCIGLGLEDEPKEYIWKGIHLFRLMQRDFKETSPLSYLNRINHFFWLAFFKITQLHVKYKYDVIHFHNVPDHGVFITWIAKLFGAKVILDIHDIVPEFYMRKFNVSENHIVIRALKFVEKVSCAFANHVITVTDIWKKRLEERALPAGKCSVVMNVPFTRLFLSQEKSKENDPNEFLVSYHGALTEPTGVDLIVKAIHLVRNEIPNIKLQIIGDGRELLRLKEMSKSLGLDDKIRFYHSVPIEEIPPMVIRADVAVDPKRGGIYSGETLSVKVMEYLGMKMPAIVSRTEAAQAYFKEDQVLFFKPDHAEDLAEKLIELFEKKELRENLSRNAQVFNDQYNWEKNKAVYFKVLDDLIVK